MPTYVMGEPGDPFLLERKAADRFLTRWETRLARAITQVYSRASKRTVAKLRSSAVRKGTYLWDGGVETKAPDADQIYSVIQVADELEEVVRPILEALLEEAGAELAAVLGSEFEPGDPFLAEALEGRVTRIRDTSQTTMDQIRRALQRGAREGVTLDKLTQAVANTMATATGYRSRMIARNETAGAANDATIAAARQSGVVVAKVWLAAKDDRVREWHANADGQTVPIDDLFEVGTEALDRPHDPNGSPANTIQCVTGDTLVEWRGGLGAAFRRWYEGDMVELVTADGHRLSITPNHPVLTLRGWVLAQALQVGDDLLTTKDVEGRDEPDVEHVPASIEKVYGSARKSGVHGRVAAGGMDFHGDGIDGEVDVVRTGSQLGYRSDPPSHDELLHSQFMVASLGPGALFSLGPSPSSPLALGAPSTDRTRPGSHGIVGGSSEGLPLSEGHPAHPDGVGFAAIPGRQTELLKPADDGCPRHSEVVGHSENGHALVVESPDFVKVDVPRSDAPGVLASTDRQPIGTKPPYNGRHGNAEGSGHSGDGHLVVVHTSKLVHVDVHEFVGHVFNLSTAEHWYSGNGICLSNCRCTLLFETAPEPSVS